MARRPRLLVPGAIYHVMSRGNRKATVFKDDLDRLVFIEALASTATRYGLRIYSYCLMSNHYHAVVDAPRHNLSDAMQQLVGDYASASNRRREQSGHVFEARFKSIIIDQKSYLKDVTGYVVLNPIRARMVAKPCDWRWSSYRATAGIDPPPHWLYCDWLPRAFGGKSFDAAQARYGRYVNSPRAKKVTIDLRSTVVGSPAFEARIRELAGQPLNGRHGNGHLVWNPPPLSELFSSAGKSLADRNLLIREAHVTHGYRLSAISRFLGLRPGTASAILRRMTTNEHD